MQGRVRDQSVVLFTGAAVVFWVAGIVLFLGVQSREIQHVGLLLLFIAATTTALGVLRSWQLRMHRAFVHGYHAGFHEASMRDCDTSPQDCDVLDFAEGQSRKLSQLG